MKKISVAPMIIFILLVGLSFSSPLAADFSFIGIKWDDDFNTVRDKIDESGLANDHRFTALQWGSKRLGSIIKDSAVDVERYKALTDIASRIEKDLHHERQLRYIEFSGKRDSMIKNASFFFAYDRDVLLAYDISLNTSIAKINEETGEGEFYQDLVREYGAATKTLKWSKVWLQKDQTLYYTAVGHTVIVTYINESNLSSYIDRLGVNLKRPEQTDQGLPGMIQMGH